MSGVEAKLGQSLDDLIKSQKTVAKKTASASKKKKTPSKGVKPAPKSKPKAGKKVAGSTPKGQKGVAIKRKTPVSVKGGVKKGKAMPMAIDGASSAGGRRARRVTSGGTTKVILVGGSTKTGKKDGRNPIKVRGETGGSINARFEKVSRERSTKGSRGASGKVSTNKFGVKMPW